MYLNISWIQIFLHKIGGYKFLLDISVFFLYFAIHFSLFHFYFSKE